MKSSLPKDYHKPFGKVKRFLAGLVMKYDWPYHAGFIDGASKKRYFEGYVDGLDDMNKFLHEEILRKYYENK